MLHYLVQTGYLRDEWIEKDNPVVWMRKKIVEHAKTMKPAEWTKICWQNDQPFIDAELQRIYNPEVEYLDGSFCESDEGHGSTVDCYVFAKAYSMVVLLYCCDSNVKASSTVFMDGHMGASDYVLHKEGIHPELRPTGREVLELV